MMATLLSLGSYLLYILSMWVLSLLVFLALSFLGSSSFEKLPKFIQRGTYFTLPFALKNFQWVVLISESHYSLPSSVPQVIAILLYLASYLVCMIIMPVLTGTCVLVWSAASGKHCDKDQIRNWIFWIMLCINFVVTDRVTNYHVDPALISEFLSSSLTFLTDIMATLISQPGIYMASMVGLSFVVLLIAHGAIQNTRNWWPELIHTSIVALTLLLLNMMWGSPFLEPSADSDMKSGLVGLSGYLIYVWCSMALSHHFFGMLFLLKTFVISLTFVLLDMFVKPCSFSDMVDTLVGLAGKIVTTLLPLLFLAALSFVVFVFLDTWADILFPSIMRHYPRGAFVSIAGLTFMVMQTVLGIPAEEPSIFSDMKAGLLGITDMINKYQGAYVVIKSLTVLVIPLLSRESRSIMYTAAAFIVALSLLPSGPDTPMEYPAATLVTDDFVQQTITSFVTSQINGVDEETKQLTGS